MDIVVVPPVRSQYEVVFHFLKKLTEALERQGAHCQDIVFNPKDPASFVQFLYRAQPDFTLSFNGFLPDDHGHFISDILEIPHVACITDAATHFMALTQSKYTVITCPDSYDQKQMQASDSKPVLFMPHAVERELSPPEKEDRPYDVVFMGSCIDPQVFVEEWRVRFPEEIGKILEQSLLDTLSNVDQPYFDALAKNLNPLLLSGKIPMTRDIARELAIYLEYAVRGMDRMKLLQSIREVPVHLFGATHMNNVWKKLLQGQDNIIFHDPVPFQEALEIMKQSKIVLNSTPTLKNGAHERIFSGLAAGALVLTNEVPYLRETFKHEDNILFYKHLQLHHVEPLIKEYLASPEKRKQVAARGRETVMQHHTWDHRAAMLMKELPAIMDQINSK